jgi:hypothetical protein
MKQKKKETEILYVHRDWQSSYNQITYIKDIQGHVLKTITSSIQQPKKNTKQLTIKGITYKLNWSYV